MTEIDGRQRLMQLTAGFAPTMAVFAAAELGIPDLIAAGTRSLDGSGARDGRRSGGAVALSCAYLVSLRDLRPRGRRISARANGTVPAQRRRTDRGGRTFA